MNTTGCTLDKMTSTNSQIQCTGFSSKAIRSAKNAAKNTIGRYHETKAGEKERLIKTFGANNRPEMNILFFIPGWISSAILANNARHAAHAPTRMPTMTGQ